MKQISKVAAKRQKKKGLISFSSFQIAYLRAMMAKNIKKANAKVMKTLKLVVLWLMITKMSELQKECIILTYMRSDPKATIYFTRFSFTLNK